MVLSATTHGMHNFDNIVGLKLVRSISAARYNFAINFHRYTAAGYAHLLDKLCRSAGFINSLAVAIYNNIHAAKVNATGAVRSIFGL